jgi:hypothetical protein
MKEDMIADLWTAVAEHLPEKQKKEAAGEFINVLLDYNIKDSMLESLHGVDSYLDQAIDYAIDGEGIDSDEEDYDNYDEDEED